MTTTANTGVVLQFALCGCCLNHSADGPLRANNVVTCAICGDPCSCGGCVAEA